MHIKCSVPENNPPHPPRVMANLTAADVVVQLNLPTGTTTCRRLPSGNPVNEIA